MKKQLVLIGAIIIGLAATVSGQGYNYRFEIEGLLDSVVYMGYHFGDQRYLKDTAQVEEGNVLVYKGDESLIPGIYFLYSPNFYFEFIAKDESFLIKTKQGGSYSEVEIEGSPQNDIFREFQVGMTAIQQEKRGYVDQLQAAASREDSTELYQKAGETDVKASEFRKTLISDYPESFVAELVWLMERPTVPEFPDITDPARLAEAKYLYYKNNFFNEIDLSNPALLRTPILFNTVNEYLNEVVIQHPDTISQALDMILSKAKSSEELYRFWLVKLFTKYQSSNIMGFDAVVVHLAENYYLTGEASWLDQESIDNLSDEMKFLKPNLLGNAAPKLSLVDTSMAPLTLEQIKADYTVLFFYDPDCGHCKKTTPVLLDIYHQIFRNSNVEVLAVCTVTDLVKWKEYISNNQLDWLNAADPYYRSNFRQNYNVRTTPTIYVLDEDKNIIAKKLDVAQIPEFIEAHRKATGSSDH